MPIVSFKDVSPWLDAHRTFWDLDAFNALGRLHACIDAADIALSAEAWHSEATSGLIRFESLEPTSFGREVGGDVPRWWVFAREPNVRDLWNDTKLTFPSSQALVRAAARLLREPTPAYDHIIRQLAEFLRRHASEIEALLGYADCLAAKHELAPAILFSYAVWGSTKRAHRSLEECSEKNRDRVRLAGELAIGVQSRLAPTLFWEWLDLSSSEDCAAVSAARLLNVVRVCIRENVITYFTELRDSLRHIDTLCQEFFQRENIYADDRFVRGLLKKISGQKSAVESDLWDIKKTLEMWSAPQAQREAAAIKLSEDVAAFANNRGGILLIGVTNDTHTIVGVADPENRIKQIERVLRKYTDPQADFVRVRAVSLDDAGVTKTCVVIVVGQTEVPIGVRQRNNNYSYPLRVGPGIERVSRERIAVAKTYIKGTAFAFAAELEAWICDVP